MSYLYLDIETIPAQSPEVRAKIAEQVTPPASMKKAETIAAWVAEQKPAAIEEAIAKTALDGTYGHICCIGWALDDEEPQTVIALDEAGALRGFSDWLTARTDNSFKLPVIVGHNVIGFDIRFIWQRAILLGVQMPSWFPRDPKPWDRDVFDTMTAFAGQRGTISMARLCEAMGMEGKGDIDGSMIAKLWADGDHQTIREYCKGDVARTREIHRRMMVAFGEAA